MHGATKKIIGQHVLKYVKNVTDIQRIWRVFSFARTDYTCNKYYDQRGADKSSTHSSQKIYIYSALCHTFPILFPI